MPRHLFSDATHFDCASAIRGNPQKQNYSVCPRHWYVDADFNCTRCSKEFTWTATEQKAWFEDYFFWIDSSPRHCKKCMSDRRHLESLRKEYDSTVSAARHKGATDTKCRIIEIVRELESVFGNLPEKMIETKDLFDRQILKAQQGAPQPPPDPPLVEFPMTIPTSTLRSTPAPGQGFCEL